MKKFPKPKHAFQYIEDRKAGDTGLDTKPSDTGYYTQFEGEVKAVSPNIAYTVSGRKYTVENGEKVVALIEDSATVKTFYKEEEHIRLQPENDYMDPILVNPDKETFQILGKVIGVFRFMK
mgnify:CR=1 FL=1